MLKRRTYKPPHTVCSLPWTGVETSPNGEARVCCLANDLITQPNGHPYNMQEHSLQDAFQSDYMKKLRQELRAIYKNLFNKDQLMSRKQLCTVT